MAEETLTPLLPHSDEAERSILGAVLLDNQQFERAHILLNHSAFYSPRHQKIYRAFEHLYELSTAMDVVTLRQELERAGCLEEIGGPAYLAELLEGVPRSANIEHYARIVREKSILRELIRCSQGILDNALRGARSADEILDGAEKAIFQVAEQRMRSGFVPLSVTAEESLQAIEELTKRQQMITGVATGFPELDEKTAGLQPGDLIILAARPAMGKTSLALNIASHAALMHGKTVGVFSLEMSHQQLFFRLLCGEGQVNAHHLRTGRVGAEEWQRIIQVYGKLSQAPVYIDDTPGVGVLEMRAKSRRLKRERGLDLLIVDYLQLMRGRGRVESRQQEISEISRSLKELAKELNVPLVALSQLSRAPEQRTGDRRPQLSDLRESGAIEQDADVVLFLFREEVYRKDDPELRGKAELILGKQRNGPTGVISLNFIRDYTRFVNPAYENIEL
jgi:replicative DNA helicase